MTLLPALDLFVDGICTALPALASAAFALRAVVVWWRNGAPDPVATGLSNLHEGRSVLRGRISADIVAEVVQERRGRVKRDREYVVWVEVERTVSCGPFRVTLADGSAVDVEPGRRVELSVPYRTRASMRASAAGANRRAMTLTVQAGTEVYVSGVVRARLVADAATTAPGEPDAVPVLGADALGRLRVSSAPPVASPRRFAMNLLWIALLAAAVVGIRTMVFGRYLAQRAAGFDGGYGRAEVLRALAAMGVSVAVALVLERRWVSVRPLAPREEVPE